MAKKWSGRRVTIARQYTLQRDRFVCWLCGHPIDLTLPYNHAYGWTLDHVVPLSLGGDPLDHHQAAALLEAKDDLVGTGGMADRASLGRRLGRRRRAPRRVGARG